MSILVDKNTRVVVQGITGKEGSFHATQCKAYGTQVVAGVTPGKAGQDIEGIPVNDMVKAKRALRGRDVRLIGPNCPGIITADECKIGIMPGFIHKKGRVGVIARSGTLTYEAVNQLTTLGLGETTCIGVGGDPIIGTGYVDLLAMFEKDPETDAVVVIGEIGGGTGKEGAALLYPHS